MSKEVISSKVTNLTGVVCNVVSSRKVNGRWEKGPKRFSVHLVRAKRNIDCYYYGFCPLEVDDIITASGNHIKYSDGSDEVEVTVQPYITIGTTKGAIMGVLYRGLPKTSLIEQKVPLIYNSLLSYANNNMSFSDSTDHPSRVSAIMDDFSNEYLNSSAEERGNNIQRYKNIIGNNFDDKYIVRLMKYWIKNRHNRRYYLLGMNNKDIDNIVAYSSTRPDIRDTYKALTNNPFNFLMIPMDKCANILKIQKKEPTTEMIRCGEIIRVIYNASSSKSWTCVRASYLFRQCPDFINYKQVLYEQYGVVFDDEPLVAKEGGMPSPTDLVMTTPLGNKIVKESYHPSDELPKFVEYVRPNADNITNDTRIYLDYNYIVEKGISEWLALSISRDLNPTERSNDKWTVDFERDDYSEDQKMAIQGAVDHTITVINGEGGSGKTTIIKDIIGAYTKHGKLHAVCSFTGKAVARLREALRSTDPSTLHRFMACNPHDITHLIIDETSMVTTELLYRFISAFPRITNVTMVGDCNQLLPIGWGAFFNELVLSGRVAIYRLIHNHRCYVVEGETDGIIENCRAIANHPKDAPFEFQREKNFRMIDGSMKTIEKFIRGYNKSGIDSRNLSIVTPYRKEVDAINIMFQEIYRAPVTPEYIASADGRKWYVNDRVMMIENNYDIDVFNGEEGLVIDIRPREGFIVVTFDLDADIVKENVKEEDPNNRQVSKFYVTRPSYYDDDYGPVHLNRLNVKDLLHSYAITVHKSQGSEWDFVAYWVPPTKPNDNRESSFLCRNLTYTAISRGKRAVYLIGDIGAITRSATRHPAYRCDYLSARVSNLLPPTTLGRDGRIHQIGVFGDNEDMDDLNSYFDDY